MCLLILRIPKIKGKEFLVVVLLRCVKTLSINNRSKNKNDHRKDRREPHPLLHLKMSGDNNTELILGRSFAWIIVALVTTKPANPVTMLLSSIGVVLLYVVVLRRR
jgi:hypothetical protein